MNKKNTKMNTKRILVSFLVIASVLFLASAVSAANLGTINTVKVNDMTVFPDTSTVSITGGDSVTVEVQFTAGDLDDSTATIVDGDASDVKLKVELEGEDIDVTAVSNPFVVLGGKTYTKTLTLKVPADLKDDLTDDLSLSIRVYNSDFEVELDTLEVSLQRPSYDVAIKSVMTSNSVEAGQLLPVDIVLKNVGYNDLDDLYVTAKISELNIEKTAYFGDLVPLKDNCDDDDDCDNENTVTGKLYLEIPYNVKAGTYTLEVKAENDDTKTIVSKEIVVGNGVPDLAMKSGNDLVLLNPTNQLKVYKVTYQDKQVSAIVPAASSKTVTIDTPATGDYNFDVLVFSGDVLLSTVNFSGTAQPTNQLTSPVLVLTVILAIVFLVLLVVLVVLITRKPQKTEEFGESYY